MEEYPKLIVTCRTGHDDICMYEIGSVIFRKDPLVRVVKTRYPGVLFVYTTLDPSRAYNVAALREYGFTEGVIPVHCVFSLPTSLEEIKKCIESLKLPSRVKLRVKARGVRGVSSELFRLVSSVLREVGIEQSYDSDFCLHVEVFETTVYLGLAHCRSVFKASS